MLRSSATGLGLVIGAMTVTAPTTAAPELAHQQVERGGFLLVGNTLGFDCTQHETPVAGGDAGGVPPPLEGTADCAGAYAELGLDALGARDLAPDLYWTWLDGSPLAVAATTARSARVGAELTLPTGSRIRLARLYWFGYLPREAATDPLVGDEQILLNGPGFDGADSAKPIVAERLWTATRCQNQSQGCPATVTDPLGYYYQASADVTSVVSDHGAGVYSVTDVDSDPAILGESAAAAAGFWLVVLHEPIEPSPGEAVELRLFHGLDMVGFDSEQSDAGFAITLDDVSPFAEENPTATLGIIGYAGDAWQGGDSVTFDGIALLNATGNAQNFFDASRTVAGAPVSGAGDFPRLSGAPRSLAGLDLDVVTAALDAAGASVPTVRFGSTFERYLVGGLFTALPTLAPVLRATKTVVPLDADDYSPGGAVRYTLSVTNVGSATATDVRFVDELPPELSLVTGSIEFAGSMSGALPTGQQTQDGQLLTLRVGTGADLLGGGALPAGATASLTLDAILVDPLTPCSTNPCPITNQAWVHFAAAGDATERTVATDSDPATAVADPTVFTVTIPCATAADCAAPLPYCDDGRCVECRSDDDCVDPSAPVCDPVDSFCHCPVGATCDEGGLDSDSDGLSDALERALGSDPEDADTDDDGVLDGDEPSLDQDLDGDGLIGLLDPDSDDDGLADGTELGLDCAHPDTDLRAGHCRPDADPSTTTDPNLTDTDGSGISDGAEDHDLNGRVDDGETDPNGESDDERVVDSDGDGLSDELERRLRSDPHDADSDDDGVPDGEEPNPTLDTDGDGRTSVMDVDSDNDGLFDGTELGYGCDGPGTDPSLGHCRPDADAGATKTSPLLRDTDGGGLSDGSEDWNLNGRIDADETDPNDPSDDQDLPDADGDGLSDPLEQFLGSDPYDADSDDDGVLDGDEPNPTDDLDGDGLIGLLDLDSDGDLLLDGVELGTACAHPDSDPRTCVVDADLGVTVTSSLWTDTDGDGVLDGVADVDLNGVIDENDELFLDAEIRGGGCGCALPARSERSPTGWLASGLLLAGLRRRRRRTA